MIVILKYRKSHIWKARDVLMLRCRWSIGDGSQIKVMQKPWIRGKDDRCVPGPQQQGIYNLVVKDLLLPFAKQWNMRLIRELFDFPGVCLPRKMVNKR